MLGPITCSKIVPILFLAYFLLILIVHILHYSYLPIMQALPHIVYTIYHFFMQLRICNRFVTLYPWTKHRFSDTKYISSLNNVHNSVPQVTAVENRQILCSRICSPLWTPDPDEAEKAVSGSPYLCNGRIFLRYFFSSALHVISAVWEPKVSMRRKQRREIEVSRN